MIPRRIYVASSWRNPLQPSIVAILREFGHEVYDFRNPAPGNKGFAWGEIDREWLKWTPAQFAELLHSHPVAQAGFALDKGALDWCDTCVLVLPCGRSAHLEAGYAAGQGKPVYFLLHEDKFEPELMYLLGTRCFTSIEPILEALQNHPPYDPFRWHCENGGAFKRPAHHAVRLLREVVELCVAAGATWQQLSLAVMDEFNKAIDRGEVGGAPENVSEEWADCAILLEVFARHAGIDQVHEVRRKLDRLWMRKWAPDAGGALYRPERVPA